MTWPERPDIPAGTKLQADEIEAILDQISLLTGAMPVLKYKTANEVVNNSSVLQDDDHLLWTVEANSIYQLTLNLTMQSATTPDFKFTFTAPVGTTWTWGGTYYDTSSVLVSNGAFTEATTGAIGGTGAAVVDRFEYIFTVGNTGGTLQLQWAQNAANATNTTVFGGSHGILLKKVA